MPSKEGSLAERVQTSFQQLSAAATTLNAFSDQLGKAVAHLDSSIQKLSIGISGWVEFDLWNSEDGFQFASEEIGYAKVGGRWGIAIRNRSGHEGADDDTSYEEWLFNDAPRASRLKAVNKIPDLFEKLAKEVARTTKAVETQLSVLAEFTTAVDAVVVSQSKVPAEVTGKR